MERVSMGGGGSGGVGMDDGSCGEESGLPRLGRVSL